jgi:hypothetical protein
VDFGLRIAECGLRIAECGFRIAECGFRNVDCGLRIAEFIANQFIRPYAKIKSIIPKALIFNNRKK